MGRRSRPTRGMDQSASPFTFDASVLPPPRSSIGHLPQILKQATALVWKAGRRPFLTSAALQALSGIALTAQILLGKELLSALIASEYQSVAAGRVLPILLGFTLCTGVIGVATSLRSNQERLLSELAQRTAYEQILDAACAVDLEEFDRSQFHDKLQRAQVNAQMRPTQIATGLLGIISGVLSTTGIAVALFLIQPILLGLLFIAYIPAWMVAAPSARAMYDFSFLQTARDRQRAYLSNVIASKEGAKEVRAFNLAPFLRARIDTLFTERLTALRQVIRRRTMLSLVGASATSGLTAATLGLLTWLAFEENLGVAGAITAASATLLLVQRLGSLVSSVSLLYEASLFLQDYNSFIDSVVRAGDVRHLRLPDRPASSAVTAPTFKRIELREVTYTYPTGIAPAVRDINIAVREGEMIALVGKNGSGKTTIAKLIGQLYFPTHGSVLWNSEAVDQRQAESLRSQMTVIFQDFFRYRLPAHENIGAGRSENISDRAGIVEAATIAGADPFLASLPSGYDTVLGPEFFGGHGLSGGQWQRVALARAFFRSAPLVLLDEPTASLDAQAEHELYLSMRRVFADKAVVLISHRFSSVMMADRIYVLENGTIIETGTHRQLVKAGGLYANLFETQASPYLADSSSS